MTGLKFKEVEEPSAEDLGGVFEMSNQELDYALASNLKMVGQPINHGSESRVVVSDFAITKSSPLCSMEYGDSPIGLVTYGVGYRVLIVIESWDGNFDITLGPLAASVELRQASARLSVIALGLGIDAVSLIPSSITGFSEFGMRQYNSLEDAKEKL